MKVDIWSDVVCPWCAIGRARFHTALDGFAHRDDVEVTWHSFELDPGAPRERTGDTAENLAAKYGMTVEKARAMQAELTATAAQDGLDFRFDRARTGNTFDAHRLLHLALDAGGRPLQDKVKGALFDAYLTGGEPIGDPDTLVRVGGAAGLDATEAAAVLAGDRYADEVRADEAQARRYGIDAVPFFVIDERYGVPGAQPAATLRQALDTAWSESNPLTVLAPAGDATGDACADGSCAV